MLLSPLVVSVTLPRLVCRRHRSLPLICTARTPAVTLKLIHSNIQSASLLLFQSAATLLALKHSPAVTLYASIVTSSVVSDTLPLRRKPPSLSRPLRYMRKPSLLRNVNLIALQHRCRILCAILR